MLRYCFVLIIEFENRFSSESTTQACFYSEVYFKTDWKHAAWYIVKYKSGSVMHA